MKDLDTSVSRTKTDYDSLGWDNRNNPCVHTLARRRDGESVDSKNTISTVIHT